MLKWEEGLKDAASLPQCHNWKLTMHNSIVSRQKLWRAKAQLEAVVPEDGWITVYK
jgi:hypothetical protein